MLKTIHIENYRSIKKISLKLDKINVILGSNGTGKSNLYKAISLLSGAVSGQLSPMLSDEGGIENVMWSGEKNSSLEAKRIKISLEEDDFEYELQLGFPEKHRFPSHFELDPIVKEESIWISGYNRRSSSQILKRRNQSVILHDYSGNKNKHIGYIYENESIFSQLSEPHMYPEVSKLKEIMSNWRFYHEFDVSSQSSIRQAQIGFRSPVLSSDGRNLAAAYQTIVEIGNVEMLNNVLSKAFPDDSFFCINNKSRFHLMMNRKGIGRPLNISEMSDGTIRFLCLSVALLSPRPPSLIILNEPESSLHPQILPAVAMLIYEASKFSQIWLTTHSPELPALINNFAKFKLYDLTMDRGETIAN